MFFFGIFFVLDLGMCGGVFRGGMGVNFGGLRVGFLRMFHVKCVELLIRIWNYF